MSLATLILALSAAVGAVGGFIDQIFDDIAASLTRRPRFRDDDDHDDDDHEHLPYKFPKMGFPLLDQHADCETCVHHVADTAIHKLIEDPDIICHAPHSPMVHRLCDKANVRAKRLAVGFVLSQHHPFPMAGAFCVGRGNCTIDDFAFGNKKKMHGNHHPDQMTGEEFMNFCKVAERPHMQDICKLAGEHPNVALGIALGFIQPWKIGSASLEISDPPS